MADVIIYSTAMCAYCVAAKNFLKSKGWAYRELRIDQDPEAMTTMLALAKRTSVPQIFINDVHIGGYDDLMALHRKGGLEPMMEVST
jgi:glutaredoxin 3